MRSVVSRVKGRVLSLETINIIVRGVLLLLLRILCLAGGNVDQGEGIHEVGDVVKEEDPWSDSSWSTLTGNLFNNDEK